MALFSTASEFHAGAPLEGGWQLSDGFSSLACALSWANADPLNISVAAAASITNFVIAKTSSIPDCKVRIARQGRNGRLVQAARTRGRSVGKAENPLWFRTLHVG
jgi:hypothetical protein